MGDNAALSTLLGRWCARSFHEQSYSYHDLHHYLYNHYDLYRREGGGEEEEEDEEECIGTIIGYD